MEQIIIKKPINITNEYWEQLKNLPLNKFAKLLYPEIKIKFDDGNEKTNTETDQKEQGK